MINQKAGNNFISSYKEEGHFSKSKLNFSVDPISVIKLQWYWYIKKCNVSCRHTNIGGGVDRAATVTALDAGVGRIIEELKKRNLYENSFILFSSDNGGSAKSFNIPLRGKKEQVLTWIKITRFLEFLLTDVWGGCAGCWICEQPPAQLQGGCAWRTGLCGWLVLYTSKFSRWYRVSTNTLDTLYFAISRPPKHLG